MPTIPLTTATKAKPLAPCCESRQGFRAIPTISMDPAHGPVPVVGYIIERDCECSARFLEHNWREHGHAVFEEIMP